MKTKELLYCLSIKKTFGTIHDFGIVLKGGVFKFILLFFLLFSTALSFGASYTSTKTGLWSDPTAWNPNGVPVPGDNVTINSGHVITHNGNLNWTSGQISGGNASLAVTGNFTVSGSANLNFWGSLNLSALGNFTYSIGNFSTDVNRTITVGGDFSLSGDLTLNNGQVIVGNDLLMPTRAITINNGGTLEIGGDVITSSTIQINNGSIDITGNCTTSNLYVNNGTSIHVGQTLISTGTIQMNNGLIDVDGNINANVLELNNTSMFVVEGTFTKSGNMTINSGTVDMVIAGDYISTGGSTTIYNNGDLYVFGSTTGCSGNGCTQIEDLLDWITSTPGLPYLSSVTAEYNASGSFTVPAGITSLVVECWGGGGGGGGSTDNKSGGSGGGGGGYARGTLSVSPGQTINFTVGAGGAGSLGTGANGNPTNFPSTSPVFVANGGTGGLANKGAAGVGGAGVGGTTNTTGGSGSVGGDNGGAGGAGANGGAGGAGGISGVGGNGLSPGGGGGGGDRQNSNVAGGNGANGKVVITFSTLPILSFSFATSIQTEIENTINVEVSLATASTSNVSVPFEIIGGTATGGGIDYTLNSTSPLTIPAGSTTNSISITIKHDLLEEDDETIVLQLGTPTNASLGSPSIHTLTIADDDYPAPSLTVSSPNICLNSSVTFTASSNCQYIERFESSPNNADPWTTIAPNPFVGGACTATYTPPSNGTLYYRYFWYRNGGHKGISTPVAVTVNTVPVKPTSITGPTTVTQGQTGIGYLVSSIANATSYVWSYSGTGVTINGSGNSVTLDFSGNATSGDLTVYAVNGCGNGQVSDSFPITVNVGCNLSVSISSDFDDSCPELVVEQGFNAQSDSYDTGATKVTFTIVRTGSAVGWSFEYEIEDASVRTISPYPSPNPQQSFAPIAVLGSSIPIEFFISNNNVGIPTDVTLRVYNIEDTNNCIADEVSKGITIKAMPAIGDFN